MPRRWPPWDDRARLRPARRSSPAAGGVATAACLVLVLQGLAGGPEDELVVPLAHHLRGLLRAGPVRRPRPRRRRPGRGRPGRPRRAETWGCPAAQDVLWVLTLTAGPWLFGRLVAAHARPNEELAAQAGAQLVRGAAPARRAGGGRRAPADRPRAARRHRPLAQRDGRPGRGGGVGPAATRPRHAAARALEEIQRAGRSALDETGRLLHLLREDADADDLAPAAVGRRPARTSSRCSGPPGSTSSWCSTGPTDGLPAGVDLSVFRIVQEGLTNVLKHAPEPRCMVGYHRGPDGVDIDLRSAGRGPVAAGRVHGRGLVGMRERVAVFGGDLDAAHDRRRRLRRARPPRRSREGGDAVTTVVLADDQEMIRVGLRVMLEARGIDVVAEAADGREAIAQVPPSTGPTWSSWTSGCRCSTASPPPAQIVAAGLPDPGAGADDVRPRRPGLPGAARRRGRLPAQEHAGRPARRRASSWSPPGRPCCRRR